MGKSKKPKQEVTEYTMSEHFGVCSGPPDAYLEVFVNEKSAWSGSQTAQGTASVDLPELFGGVKKEGGVKGTIAFLHGESDQTLSDFLAAKLGKTSATCPGFRGLASLFFTGASTEGFYWTANSPYLPGVWAKVQRIFKRSDGTDQWYPAKAAIAGPNATTDPIDLSAEFPVLEVGDPGYPAPTSFYPHSVTLGPYSQTANVVAGSPDGTGVCHADDFFFFNGVKLGTVADYYYAPGTVLHTIPEGETVTIQVQNTINPYSGIAGALHVAFPSAQFYDMNPAHIIHEALTNTDWGMGTPTSALDNDAFTEAADTLYAEEFGLSMIWTRQTSIEDFIQEVLDHIQAVLYADPSTGLLTLKLIRGDYDEGSLPVLDPDNADLTNFSRKLHGDIVNEITVTWTNPANEQEETVTAQDLASIASQGGVVSDSRNYYGVRNANLATSLAYRDLRSAGQPLSTCEVETDRTFWSLRPASVVKVTWPEYGLDELVMRVTSIDYGKPGDPTIKMALIEDVYGLDLGAYDTPPATEWSDPSALPSVMDPVEIFTLPYFMAGDVTAGLDPVYPDVAVGILATTDNSDTYEYALVDEVTLSNGDSSTESLGDLNVIGRGTLVDPLVPEVSSAGVTFADVIGNTAPVAAGFAIIGEDGEVGNEIAQFATVGATYTLTRGVLDTVPRAWPAGTPVWFVDESTVFEDPALRSAGETVDYKLLSRTSRGVLDYASAPLESATLTERPWLPTRPANVTAYGEAWSDEANIIDAVARPDPWVTVTWANRNRLTEDTVILDWDDADVTPETGQTTVIQVCDADGIEIALHDGLTGVSFDVPDASFGTETIVRLRVWSERTDADGDFVSLQYFEHWVQVGPLTFDSTLVTFDSDTWTMDEG